MAKGAKGRARAGTRTKATVASGGSAGAGRSDKARRRRQSAAEARRLAAERAARRARLQWLAVIGAGVAIVVAVVGFAVLDAAPEGGDTSATDWDLPALANDPNGDGRITLAEFRGTPVVANFYADWCTSCDAELPGFATVSAELRDRVVFVGVNSQESGDRFRQPRQFGNDWWPLARDINGRQGGGSGLFDSLGGTGMPITAFYRADGSLAFVQRGAMSEADLRAVIRTEFGVDA